MADNGSWLDWIISVVVAGLVTWIFHSIVVVGFLGATGVSLIGSVGTLLLILAVVVVIGGIVFGMGRGEHSNEAFIRMKREVMDRLRRFKPTAILFGKYWETRDETLPGELPFEIKARRIEIYSLMNQILRHEIYKIKRDSVNKMIDRTSKYESILGETPPILENIHSGIKDTLEGKEIPIKDGVEDWLSVSGVVIGENNELKPTVTDYVGIARNYPIIFSIMGILKRELEADLTVPIERHELSQVPTIRKNQWVNSVFNQYTKTLEVMQKQYFSAIRKFRVYNFVKAHSLLMSDLYLMFGQYWRGYLFAKPGAIPKYYPFSEKSHIDKDSDTGITRDIDFSALVKDEHGNAVIPQRESKSREVIEKIRLNYEKEITLSGSERIVDKLIEVNILGWCISDINAIQMERRNLPYIRRYNKDDLIFVSNTKGDDARFTRVLRWLIQDWDGFIVDLFLGTYHPYSKDITDYTKNISKGYIDFTKVKFEKEQPEDERVTFDLEGLKNPGLFVYRSRKRYYDETRASFSEYPKNIYPFSSMLGTWMFIKSTCSKIIEDSELAHKFLDELSLGYEDLEVQTKKGGG